MATNSIPKELDPENVGITVESSYEKTLRLRVKELLNCTHENFPGALPVSLDTTKLSLLEQEDYFVCEKSDGVRYMLLSVHTAKGPASFLIDRNNSYHYIESLLLPDKENHNKYHHETLLDGELVINKDKETNQKTLIFLVFDLMVHNSTIITQRPFSSRLGLLRQEIIEPLDSYLKSRPEISKRMPFSIVLKRVERSYGLKLVLSNLPLLEHDTDGLIFTPVFFPYKSGTCSKLLKWKPPELSTADLRICTTLNADRKPVYQLQVAAGSALKVLSPLQLTQELYAKWRSAPPEGKIGEFRWDPNWPVTTAEKGYAPQTVRGGWIFLRFRPDKNAPNDEATAKKAIRAVEEGVTRETLEVFSDGIRTHWKERERLQDPHGNPQRPAESKPAEESTSNIEANVSQDLDSSMADVTKEQGEPDAESAENQQTDQATTVASTEEEALPLNGGATNHENSQEQSKEQSDLPVEEGPAEQPHTNGNLSVPSDVMEVDPPIEPAVEDGLVLRPLLSRVLAEDKRAASVPSAELPSRVARRQHSDSNIDLEPLNRAKPVRHASPLQEPSNPEPSSQSEPAHQIKKPRLKERSSIDDRMESGSPFPAPPSSEALSEVPMEVDPPLPPKRTSSLFAIMSPEPPTHELGPELVNESAPDPPQEVQMFARPNNPMLSSETKSNSSSTRSSMPPTEPKGRRKSKSRKTSRIAHLLNGNPADPSSGDASNMTPPVMAPSPPLMRPSPPPMRPSPPSMAQPRQSFEPHFRPPYFPSGPSPHSRGDPPYSYPEMHPAQSRFIPNPHGLPQGMQPGHPQGHPQSHPSYPPPGTHSGPQTGAYLFGSMAPGTRPAPHPVLTPQQLTSRDANMRRGSFGMPSYYKPYPDPNMPEHGRLPMSTGLPNSGNMRRSSLSQSAWVNGRPEPYPQHMQAHPAHGPKYGMGSYPGIPGRPMQPNVPIMHRPIAANPASSNPPPHPNPGMRPRPFPIAPPPGFSQSYPLLNSSQPYPVGHPPPQAYGQGYPFTQGHQPNSNQSMHPQFQSPQSIVQSLNQHPSPRPTPGQAGGPGGSTPPSRQSKGMLDFIMNP